MNRSRTILAAFGAAVLSAGFVSQSSVTISGPSSVKPNTKCAFWGQSSGGEDPSTWSWSGGLGGAAYGDEYHTFSPTSGGFTVQLTVLDGSGNPSTAYKSVSVSPYAPDCLI